MKNLGDTELPKIRNTERIPFKIELFLYRNAENVGFILRKLYLLFVNTS